MIKLSSARLLSKEINDDGLGTYYMENVYNVEMETDNSLKYGNNPTQGN